MKVRPALSEASTSKLGIPSLVFWILIPVCLAAVTFALVNVGSSSYLASTKIAGVKFGMIFFSIWLISGITVAFITGGLSFIDFFVKRSLSTTVIGGLSLAVGTYEIFYFFLSLQNSAPEASTYSRWFISRCLHLILILGATFYFSFSRLKGLRNPDKRKSRLIGFHIGNFLGLILAIVCTYLLEDNFIWDFKFLGLQHPFELLIIASYLFLGCFILPTFLKRFPSLFANLLGLSLIPAVLSSLIMALHVHHFDVLFNTAYFLRVVQYLMPLLGIGLNYIESSNKERFTVKQLRAQIRERVRTQQKLKQREALLANAEKIAHLGSWNFDPQTRELNWSDEMYAIFGVEPGSYKPEPDKWQHWIAEDYREMVQERMGSAVRSQTSYSIEFPIVRPDGRLRYILGQGYYSKEDKKLIGVMLDLTEVKEAGYKIEQSEALLKEAEALSHNGSWEWSQEKNAFFWSDEMYRIHGLEPQKDELDLRVYLTLIHPGDVERFVTTLADTQSHLNEFSIDYRIVRPDNEVRYLSLNGKFKKDFSGNVNKVLGNTQDVTALKIAAIKLEQSESIYRTIVKNVPDSAIFFFDKDLALVLSGGPALEVIDPENLILNAHNFHYLFFKNKDSQPLLYFNMALDGQENSLEHRINSKIFKITFTPVSLTGGAIFGIMVVMNDITDLKVAQQSLELKVNELNRSNRDLEQFAYIASHDLQEPLRKIRAFGERLNMKYKADLKEDGVDYLNRMNSASERMQHLIEDLLTFSRISRTGEELKPVNIHETIAQVLVDLEFSIEQQQAVVNCQCAHDIKVVPSLLRLLFQNLISNSIKFARRDSPLVIDICSEIVNGKDYKGLDKKKNYCKIEVTDNGIGFENQFSEKIFVLFHRLHPRHVYEGTGIGLAICKKIVENHNGIIEAEGVENRGATFRIFFPTE
ncbi:sensor histidine kinase [Desertivirga arenae]|uniref:sensor histidine kinase n=1 Tax=Desertivirga arenae TaxID=2810309 RepID=UPI001A9740A1|nr:PAS domain-containing protein [Pedobacter sp. SYSU D00823]